MKGDFKLRKRDSFRSGSFHIFVPIQMDRSMHWNDGLVKGNDHFYLMGMYTHSYAPSIQAQEANLLVKNELLRQTNNLLPCVKGCLCVYA